MRRSLLVLGILTPALIIGTVTFVALRPGVQIPLTAQEGGPRGGGNPTCVVEPGCPACRCSVPACGMPCTGANGGGNTGGDGTSVECPSAFPYCSNGSDISCPEGTVVQIHPTDRCAQNTGYCHVCVPPGSDGHNPPADPTTAPECTDPAYPYCGNGPNIDCPQGTYVDTEPGFDNTCSINGVPNSGRCFICRSFDDGADDTGGDDGGTTAGGGGGTGNGTQPSCPQCDTACAPTSPWQTCDQCRQSYCPFGPSVCRPITSSSSSSVNTCTAAGCFLSGGNAFCKTQGLGCQNKAVYPFYECSGVCGNGELESASGETCDDGNTCGGDCCTSTCQVDPTCACAVSSLHGAASSPSSGSCAAPYVCGINAFGACGGQQYVGGDNTCTLSDGRSGQCWQCGTTCNRNGRCEGGEGLLCGDCGNIPPPGSPPLGCGYQFVGKFKDKSYAQYQNDPEALYFTIGQVFSGVSNCDRTAVVGLLPGCAYAGVNQNEWGINCIYTPGVTSIDGRVWFGFVYGSRPEGCTATFNAPFESGGPGVPGTVITVSSPVNTCI